MFRFNFPFIDFKKFGLFLSIVTIILLQSNTLFLIIIKSTKEEIMSSLSLNQYLQKPAIIQHLIKDNGIFPNNNELPLVLYQSALKLPQKNPAEVIEKILQSNQWRNSWRNGLYSFHHYHSTAHEVLAIYSGSVQVQFGGDNGIIIKAKKGDVIIIPAGLSHKNLGSSHDFIVVGAYPQGQYMDMNYGKKGERPKTDQTIANLALPKLDPIFGKEGYLFNYWIKKRTDSK